MTVFQIGQISTDGTVTWTAEEQDGTHTTLKRTPDGVMEFEHIQYSEDPENANADPEDNMEIIASGFGWPEHGFFAQPGMKLYS